MNYKMGEVIRNNPILDDTYEMEIAGFTNAVQGQFVNISTGDKSMLLRRPISISEVREESIVIHKTRQTEHYALPAWTHRLFFTQPPRNTARSQSRRS